MAPTNYYGAPGTLWSIDSTASSERGPAHQPEYRRAAGGRQQVVPGHRASGERGRLPLGGVHQHAPLRQHAQRAGHRIFVPGQPAVGLGPRRHRQRRDRSQPSGVLAAEPELRQIRRRRTTSTSARTGCSTPARRPAPAPASVCQTNEDCCGATATPPTAACRIDQPATVPSDASLRGDQLEHSARRTVARAAATRIAAAFPARTASAGVCKPPPPVVGVPGCVVLPRLRRRVPQGDDRGLALLRLEGDHAVGQPDHLFGADRRHRRPGSMPRRAWWSAPRKGPRAMAGRAPTWGRRCRRRCPSSTSASPCCSSLPAIT